MHQLHTCPNIFIKTICQQSLSALNNFLIQISVYLFLINSASLQYFVEARVLKVNHVYGKYVPHFLIILSYLGLSLAMVKFKFHEKLLTVFMHKIEDILNVNFSPLSSCLFMNKVWQSAPFARHIFLIKLSDHIVMDTLILYLIVGLYLDILVNSNTFLLRRCRCMQCEIFKFVSVKLAFTYVRRFKVGFYNTSDSISDRYSFMIRIRCSQFTLRVN